ncbi:MAG: hypothetical protein K8S98_16345 [Planctomycetes bacterium]|nr:hypothetical protein [Planctomycetota bacterium]
MHPRDIATLICRSFALWLAVDVVVQVPAVIAAQRMADSMPEMPLHSPVVETAALHFAAALVLWFLGSPIAALMVRGMRDDSAEPRPSVDAAQLVFAAIGVFIVAHVGPDLGGRVIGGLASLEKGQSVASAVGGWRGCVEDVLSLVVAVWLVLGSRRLAELWRDTRTLGLKKA